MKNKATNNISNNTKTTKKAAPKTPQIRKSYTTPVAPKNPQKVSTPQFKEGVTGRTDGIKPIIRKPVSLNSARFKSNSSYISPYRYAITDDQLSNAFAAKKKRKPGVIILASTLCAMAALGVAITVPVTLTTQGSMVDVVPEPQPPVEKPDPKPPVEQPDNKPPVEPEQPNPQPPVEPEKPVDPKPPVEPEKPDPKPPVEPEKPQPPVEQPISYNEFVASFANTIVPNAEAATISSIYVTKDNLGQYVDAFKPMTAANGYSIEMQPNSVSKFRVTLLSVSDVTELVNGYPEHTGLQLDIRYQVDDLNNPVVASEASNKGIVNKIVAGFQSSETYCTNELNSVVDQLKSMHVKPDAVDAVKYLPPATIKNINQVNEYFEGIPADGTNNCRVSLEKITYDTAGTITFRWFVAHKQISRLSQVVTLTFDMFKAMPVINRLDASVFNDKLHFNAPFISLMDQGLVWKRFNVGQPTFSRLDWDSPKTRITLENRVRQIGIDVLRQHGYLQRIEELIKVRYAQYEITDGWQYSYEVHPVNWELIKTYGYVWGFRTKSMYSNDTWLYNLKPSYTLRITNPQLPNLNFEYTYQAYSLLE